MSRLPLAVLALGAAAALLLVATAPRAPGGRELGGDSRGEREVVARLRERDPGLRVLFISGYTDRAVLRHGLLDGDYDFLEKPFSLNGLAARVREILGRPEDKKRGTGVVTRP